MIQYHYVPRILYIQFAVLVAVCFAQFEDPVPKIITHSRIAVLELDAPDLPASGRAILSDLIRQELLKGEGITLIDRSHIVQMVTEQGLQDIGIIDDQTLIRTGKLLGAEKIVTGRVGNLGELYLITLQMLDVETGRIDRLVEESYLGPLERLTIPIRASAQKLLGIGGEKTLKSTRLRVTSAPPGARVYVNDLFEGNTPLILKIFDPGEHNVKILAPGYAYWEQGIELAAGETNFVAAELIELIGDDASIDPSQWQDGRKSLLAFSSFYTIWLINGSLAALGVESRRPYIGGWYVGAPIGFFAVLNLTKNKPVTEARTNMIVTSAMWGSMWGLSAASMLQPTTAKPLYALSLLGGNLALLISVNYTATHNISSSRVALTNLGSFLGTLLGLGVPYLLNIENQNIYMTSMIAGGLGGAYYGFKLTKRFDDTLPSFTRQISTARPNDRSHPFTNLALLPQISLLRYHPASEAKTGRRQLSGYVGMQFVLY